MCLEGHKINIPYKKNLHKFKHNSNKKKLDKMKEKEYS